MPVIIIGSSSSKEIITIIHITLQLTRINIFFKMHSVYDDNLKSLSKVLFQHCLNLFFFDRHYAIKMLNMYIHTYIQTFLEIFPP